MQTIIAIKGINPTPWTVGPLTIIKRNGKSIPIVGKAGDLEAYQNAVRDEVARKLGPGFVPYSGRTKVLFTLWREIEEWTNPTTGRLNHGQVSDATNLQKALEDCLQKVLFVNDRNNVDVRTVLVAQGVGVSPFIGIKVQDEEPYDAARVRQVWESRL